MAYNSKYTGAQIDALLDASETMQTSKEDVANKVKSLDANVTDEQYPSAKAVKDAIATKENTTNKVTSINADADDDHYPSAKAVWSAIKAGIATNVEKGEIFEIGYPDSYWIEDELISATDFSVFKDFYSGEIDDLSGNNNKLTVSGLSSIDYSTSIAGIRGGELIKNPYNSIGDSIEVNFTTPEDIDTNLLTIEVYANIHASYKWNRKVIQTASNPAINNAYIFQIGVLYRLAINANTIKHYGSLGEDVLEVSHDNSFIDGALDTEIKNQYTHLVFTVNNIDKTDKLYVNSEKVLEVTNRKSLDSVANRAVTLFGNWAANIKCVRIYNKELSQEEVTQNYEATKNYYAV